MYDTHYEAQAQTVEYAEQFEEKVASLAELRSTAFYCMDQLDGWCSHEKAGILIDLIMKVRPKTIVEIGVWGGKSLVPMACALKANDCGKIFGIDPWNPVNSLQWVNNESNENYWSRVDHEGIMNTLISKIDQFGLEDHIELIRSTSGDAPIIPDIDILHIDGNHTEPSTFLDVTKWVPLVKRGGWIIFDDMTWCENGIFTAAKAVAWLDDHCVRFAQFSEGCDWGIWYKP